MAIFETHCHLNHLQFADDYEDVIDRANRSNVRRLLVVSYDLASSRRAVTLAESLPGLSAAIGIHPEDLTDWTDENRLELQNLSLSHKSSIVAWGEIGLDYHWKTFAPDIQKAAFEEQLVLARSLELPVIVHCRDAYEDTLGILKAFGYTKVVIHCFTGTVEQARRAVDLGYSIGIGGVVTYKSAQNVRDIAAEIPLDRLLIETDSPFLAPQTHRGKRNEPAYIVETAQKVAELRGMPANDLEEVTYQNAVRLFG